MSKIRYIFAGLMIFVCAYARAGEVREHYLDAAYGERKLPIKVYVPSDAKSCPMIIYSHGLGGSRETKGYLLKHWAKAGFICVSVQHPGSDADIWKNASRGQKIKALKNAGSAEQFLNRARDIPAALDQLEKWNVDEKHILHNAIDFSRVGMSGHSFGAITSQVMMGAKYGGDTNAGDKRFTAFLLLSPSPAKGRTPQEAFAHVEMPVLCMTGTEDKSLIQASVDCEARISVYRALPEGKKYLYVFEGGKHNLFSGPTRINKALTEEHRLIQDLTLLFWQTYLQSDKDDYDRLQAFEPGKGDEWYNPRRPNDNR